MQHDSKKILILKYLLFWASPVWMPLLGAYIDLGIRIITHLEFGDLLAWPIIFGALSLGVYGQHSLLALYNWKTLDKWVVIIILYAPAASFALFVFGWVSLGILGFG